jgi:diguanylate cyclase (GGDEF)-like protein/PAS domain S-box-containing protein
MKMERAEKFSDFLKPQVSGTDQEWFAQIQLNVFNGAMRLAFISYCLVFTLICYVYRDMQASYFLGLSIFLFVSIIITQQLSFWRLMGFGRSSPDLRPTVWHSRIAALCWGAIIGIPIAFRLTQEIDVLAMIAMGLIILATIALSTHLPAARNHSWVLGAIIFTALIAHGTAQSYKLATLIALYTVLTDKVSLFLYGNFAARTVGETNLIEAAETIKLALKDFEEQSSDWLWEADADGYLVNPSPRAAQATGMRIEDCVNFKPIDLLVPGPELTALVSIAMSGSAYRDIEVPVLINGEERWWCISGRPQLDADGKIVRTRGTTSDITEAKHAAAKIAHLARYDSLTDLPNRMLFGETLTRAIARRPENKLLAVLYLDIDHFKSINDMLGHAIGDQVLKIAASRIENSLGLNDIVGRQGGDEFSVILPEIASRAEAEAVADAIVAALAEPIIIDDQQINTGASVGIAYAPDDGESAQDLIKSADLALYHAKQNGRGRHSTFEINMHEAMKARRQIEIDLRSAINRDELELYYQPLINLESGDIIGYEALLRWNHPNGMVMPDTFIPVAEETGLIVPLGEWVIRNALNEVKRWPEHLGVAVNLSPAQMRSPNLIPTIVNALAASGVQPHRLEMEITETVLMQDTDANLSVLHKLRALGVRIALDDFGTGYSSLNYLRSFPFDKIKIDRCFVNDVDSRDDSRAIVRAVTGLASSLGMVTTAEGVEREDQLDELRREGCTEVQGYFFSRPMPANHVIGRSPENGSTTTVARNAPASSPMRKSA